MAQDDQSLFKIIRDISGGINNRQYGSMIENNQVTVLKNVDIGVAGESRKISGLTLAEDLGDDPITSLLGFMPSNGTYELIATHGTKLESYTGSGTFAERKTDFTAGSPTVMLKAGEEGENDVVLVKVTGNNWFRMKADHTFQDLGSTSGTGTDSPIDTTVALWYRQRLWMLKNNWLYYSTVFPADFSVAFDTVSDAYKVDVGEERALVSIRDQGIVILGLDAIYGVNPSTTPAATDKVEKLLDLGCVAGKTAVQVGDDVLFLAKDGIRGLFRSQQDKLQTGTSYPLSYRLKEEFEDINWAYIEKASAVFYDNKYMISLPTGSSTVNNSVWVYYPSTQAWVIIDGWNVADWGKVIFGGEERLFAGDSIDGKVYRAWYGYSNNGTAIVYQEEGRKEDFSKPLVTKTGGEFRVKVLSSGDYELDVYLEFDDGGYNLAGTINLSGDAPSLPVSLPFTLGANNIKEATFHLDKYGPYKTVRYKLVQNTLNGSDEIKVYERSFVTFEDKYASE